MELSALTALSPLDGRYGAQASELRPWFSELALIRARVRIEVEWLAHLAREPGLGPEPDADALERLSALADGLSEDDAREVKALERTTNHDVKAVEYFVRDHLPETPRLAEFVHFACTSEDINNLAWATLVHGARADVLLPRIDALAALLRTLSRRHAATPMLARTHGQAASPTTMGKELANFVARIERQREQIAEQPILGKMNGATGNFNAHAAAYPDADWQRIAERFVRDLGLEWNPYTTQIEPHDWSAELLEAIARLNTVLIDLARDIWGYIALGYFRSRAAEGEVGSSTMPHKVNPIDFENAEGNLGVANALLGFLAEKLPVSRWQRDLTDSTVTRNMGTAIAHCIIAWRSCLKGLDKLEANTERIEADLDNNPEVLAEALQTVMRRYGIEGSYEMLKELTRGRRVTLASLREFISGLDLPADVKATLSELGPRDYIGNAVEQTGQIIAGWKEGKG